MVQLQPGDYNGLACVWLSNNHLRLAVTTGWGPRVVFCGFEQGRNFFAELPDLSEATPNGTFRFLGGHRLWYAPESKETTYWPDEWPIEVVETERGARFIAPADGIGVIKEIEIELARETPEVLVHHVLRNTGSRRIELAPWALTMLRMGGVAILPQHQASVDEDNLLPNRHVVFWPYSDPGDERMQWQKRVVLLHGRSAGANKLGYRNRHGWIGYWLDGALFTVLFDATPEGHYPDLGCNVESFVKDRFLELETLGLLVELEPGDSVIHDERWRLSADIPSISSEEDALTALAAAGLQL